MADRRELTRRELTNEINSVAMTINSYAALMGYLYMAIKGVGFLILTWTTVVLLGGFVSALHKKDFWCLTFITLVTAVQTTGIFDVYLNERLTYILSSAYDMLEGSLSAFSSKNVSQEGRNVVITPQKIIWAYLSSIWVFLERVSVVVQMLVLAILVCPLTAVYMFGGLMSAGVSLLRLIQHDYGGNSDEQANLKPAMDTLYSLASLQGVLFFYRFIFGRAGKRMVMDLIPTYGHDEHKAVWTYLSDTRIGCEKNPSFARGRNFITHAVDLIGSRSPHDCLSGVHLLYTAIWFGESGPKIASSNKHRLMKHLIMSALSSPVLEKLLQTLNPRGVYGKEMTQMRNKAAGIVAYLALDIHLEQFPVGIQYISSLIGTFEEYRLIKSYPKGNNVGDWEDHGKLVLRGLCILRKLAADENNHKIMSETQGLLPKILAPLTSDLIHQFSDGPWSIRVVEGSLKVMHLLVAALGETGSRIRREISNNKEAIHTMETILNCRHCNVKLREKAMRILTQLYMDTKSSPTFIKMLVAIFAAGAVDRSIRELAGEALAKLCFQRGGNTCIILQLDGDVVGSLTKILLDDENRVCRIRAAEILEHMCNIHHTLALSMKSDESISIEIQHNQDDECISKMKKIMTSIMPKVLEKILGYEFSKDETQARAEPDQLEIVVKEEERGVEDQKYWDEVELEEDESENDEHEEFCAPLLSLCVTVFDTFISADQDLQFDVISLPKKLNEMVEKNSDLTVRCLRLMKTTCQMVTSMMEHNGNYGKNDLDSLMNALSSASEHMRHLDMTMVFAIEEDGAQRMKPLRSLSSLVKEAKESVQTRMATKAHESENMEPSTSSPPPMGHKD
ncbi:hypothetical protein ACQJBY_041904 [Aegilops geniculata]